MWVGERGGRKFSQGGFVRYLVACLCVHTRQRTKHTRTHTHAHIHTHAHTYTHTHTLSPCGESDLRKLSMAWTVVLMSAESTELWDSSSGGRSASVSSASGACEAPTAGARRPVATAAAAAAAVTVLAPAQVCVCVSV